MAKTKYSNDKSTSGSRPALDLGRSFIRYSSSVEQRPKRVDAPLVLVGMLVEWHKLQIKQRFYYVNVTGLVFFASPHPGTEGWSRSEGTSTTDRFEQPRLALPVTA